MSIEIPLKAFKQIYLMLDKGKRCYTGGVAREQTWSDSGTMFHIFEAKNTIATIENGVVVYSIKLDSEGKLDDTCLVKGSTPLMRIYPFESETLYEEDKKP